MQYFLVEIGTACAATHATDDKGRFVEAAGSPKPWEVARAFVTIPLLDHEKDVDSSDELCDAITLGLDWLISERVLAALEAVAIDPNVGFLPTVVRNRKGSALATFYLVYSRGFHSVLNIERSGAVVFDDGAVDVVSKWVIERKSVPEWDLFLAHDEEWVASERVRDLVSESHFSGIRFRKVTCS